MQKLKCELNDLLAAVRQDVDAFEAQPRVILREAFPPSMPGVYGLYWQNELQYVGEARGSGGLRDRLLRKHLSGDDRHAVQRAFAATYPDRKERREYILENVFVKWVEVPAERTSLTERLLITLLRPNHNRS